MGCSPLQVIAVPFQALAAVFSGDSDLEAAKQTHSIPDLPICKRGGFFDRVFSDLFRRNAPGGGRDRPSGIFRNI
jgi:hypothetical protein